MLGQHGPWTVLGWAQTPGLLGAPAQRVLVGAGGGPLGDSLLPSPHCPATQVIDKVLFVLCRAPARISPASHPTSSVLALVTKA